MSGATVRYKVDFGKRRPRVQPATSSVPSRAARMLALAYYVERLIDDGAIESYADAARMLGLSRARMTQVMDLLVLSTEVQEAILVGEKAVTERALRSMTKRLDWREQEPLLIAPDLSRDSGRTDE